MAMEAWQVKLRTYRHREPNARKAWLGIQMLPTGLSGLLRDLNLAQKTQQ